MSVFGWVLLASGACVLLYLVYALLFTNVAANRAQSDLLAQWDQQVADAAGAPTEAATAPAPTPTTASRPSASPEPAEQRAAPLERGVALLEFARPGSDQPIVHDEPLVVLDGVTVADLQDGPGHYPNTAQPGRPGNFAVAGHRTTYGAPFFRLDALQRGDEVRVTDRKGRRYTYQVVRQQIVLPSATWVIGPDPLQTGEPTLTLTTCNPRFSAAQRLIVHAELVS